MSNSPSSNIDRRQALLGMMGAAAATVALAGTASAVTENKAPTPAPEEPFDARQIQALAFDIQGTCLDYYTTLFAGVKQSFVSKGITLEVEPFITEWRTGYRTVIDSILAGQHVWVPTELVYADALDLVLDKHNLGGKFSRAERTDLADLWSQMTPWPDVRSGLEKMRAKFITTTLSNSGMGTVGKMLKKADLRYDFILTAELARSFKPEAGVYRLVPANLGIPVKNIMMIACHKYDLAGARKFGFRTGYVPRPHELGPNGKRDAQPEAYIDVIAEDFNELASKLEA